jgi:hypothetical protein
VKELHEEDLPFKSVTDQFSPPDTYQRVELQVTLPFDMAVEQIEFSLGSPELFSKYLRLLRIETP